MRALATAAVLTALAPVGSAAAAAPVAESAAKACGRVENPYPGTRYEGVDLRRIRAVGVSCHGARRVARRAHRKALGITPPPSGIRHFTWNGWSVTGDIRGETDRYVAKRGAKRVRWLF
jgi:hypothetical protein